MNKLRKTRQVPKDLLHGTKQPTQPIWSGREGGDPEKGRLRQSVESFQCRTWEFVFVL